MYSVVSRRTWDTTDDDWRTNSIHTLSARGGIELGRVSPSSLALDAGGPGELAEDVGPGCTAKGKQNRNNFRRG